ncbi:hypothetical protein C4577_06970 [Candidatus Parcubacteria bacterium]|nr:MAG: hypothetical protein C4577_06970 [Candidatus Parcubacteria bacterium]
MNDQIGQYIENGAPRVEQNSVGQESNKDRAKSLNAGKIIFDGVYDQIRRAAYGKTSEEQGQRFVEWIAQKAQMHIGEIQSQNLTFHT